MSRYDEYELPENTEGIAGLYQYSGLIQDLLDNGIRVNSTGEAPGWPYWHIPKDPSTGKPIPGPDGRPAGKRVDPFTPTPDVIGKTLAEEYRQYVGQLTSKGLQKSILRKEDWDKNPVRARPQGDFVPLKDKSGKPTSALVNAAVAFALREAYPLTVEQIGSKRRGLRASTKVHLFVQRLRSLLSAYIEAGLIEIPESEAERRSRAESERLTPKGNPFGDLEDWGDGRNPFQRKKPTVQPGVAPVSAPVSAPAPDIKAKVMDMVLEGDLTIEEAKAFLALYKRITE
jgi:hypothetical protein